MVFFSRYYFFSLLLIYLIKSLQANDCYECNVMHFHYPITADTLPSPDRSDCKIKSNDQRCYVGVTWYDDGTSLVAYSADVPFPTDNILINTRRSVNASNIYTTSRTLGYTCLSDKANESPCNNVNMIRRSLIATTLPSEETSKSFDSLIARTVEFNSSLCLNYTNFTNNCDFYDIVDCQQCVTFVQYTQPSEVCATCPASGGYENSISLDTTIFLDNHTDFDIVSLLCQIDGGCNSIENANQIKQRFHSSFDYNKFFYSTASTDKSTILILFAIFFVFVFHWIQ